MKTATTSAPLENAPGFDKDHWPDNADLTWQQAAHTHYGQPPYWEGTSNSSNS